jgi:lipoprotein NlpI
MCGRWPRDPGGLPLAADRKQRARLGMTVAGCLFALALGTGCQAGGTRQTDSAASQREVAEHLAAGRYEIATKALESMIAADPQVAEWHFQLGNARFMNGQMAGSVAAYDRAIQLQPDLAPYCWQRGLALYFAGQFELGQQQFESHQNVNRQDVENSVWHMLCQAQVAGLPAARKTMIPIRGDQRVPMPEVFDLFAGNGSVEQVREAAREAPVRSQEQRDTYMYYAWLYSGMFYEMTAQPQRARECMQQAAKVNPLPKGVLMGSIADVWLMLRNPDNPQ